MTNLLPFRTWQAVFTTHNDTIVNHTEVTAQTLSGAKDTMWKRLQDDMGEGLDRTGYCLMSLTIAGTPQAAQSLQSVHEMAAWATVRAASRTAVAPPC